MIKPYVYRIEHKELGLWYIGLRYGNKVPATHDVDYWGSSKYLKALRLDHPAGWSKTIIAEFDSIKEASDTEQKLIGENWDSPGRINKWFNGFIDWTDPAVKEKHRLATGAAARKRATDPTWLAATREKLERLRNIPEIENKRIANSTATNKNRAVPGTEWYKTCKQKAFDRARNVIATNEVTGEQQVLRGNDEIRKAGFTQSAVSQCCAGKRVRHKGFTFKWA